MPKKQSSAAKRARAAARSGAKYTEALRAEQAAGDTLAPAIRPETRWAEDPTLDAPDGHYWARPVPDDCPNCPCHTYRVCSTLAWHRADRPTYPDGRPYDQPCPCEQAAPAPEPRTVALTVAGISRTVPALYHRHGFMQGHLQVVGYPFRAVAEDGTEGRCGMVLAPGPDDLPDGLCVRDDAGGRWALHLGASTGGRPALITGWWDPRGRTPVFEVEQSGADSDGWDPDDPYGDVEEYERSAD